MSLALPGRCQVQNKGGYHVGGGCNMEVNAHSDKAPCSIEKQNKFYDLPTGNQ